MSFARPPSPPPPMPSPQLIPTPLPSPPPFPKQARPRPLQHSPPIPPRLIGPPLLQKTLNAARSYDRLDRRAKAGLFGDDDDFGTRRQRENRHAPSSPATRHTRRSRPHPATRCRSPPPSPAVSSPPPPVPPIPAFITRPVLEHPAQRRRCPSTPQPGHAITCMQFFAMHNPRPDLSV